MNKIFLLTIISVSLNSCITYGWVSLQKPTSQLESDYANCRDWGYHEFPPVMTHTTNTTYVPLNHYRSNNISNTLYIPQTNLIATDININARENAVKKCMMDNSWRWQRIN